MSRELDSARAAWPAVHLEAAAFTAFVAAVAARAGEPAPGPAGLCTDDLYLACACLAHDPAALVALDGMLAREVDLATARITVPGADAADLKQRLRARLLVGDQADPPRLGEYGGRGSLRAWLRVVAVREALQARRKLVRERPLHESDLLALPATGDPELERLKRAYRGEFQTAFVEALAALASRERNLLRAHFMNGLGIDDLAPLFGVHRATAARWLVKARERLHAETVERLRKRLGLPEGELESVMRLIYSQLDVSLSRVFARDEAAPGPSK